METTINILPATDVEKRKIIEFLINNIREFDKKFTEEKFTEDEQIDTFFYFNETFRNVTKIEISFNGIERTLFSAIRIQNAKLMTVFETEEKAKRNESEECFILELYHSYFELLNGEIHDITLDDYIILSSVSNLEKQ
jgi:hypothetical protein